MVFALNNILENTFYSETCAASVLNRTESNGVELSKEVFDWQELKADWTQSTILEY